MEIEKVTMASEFRGKDIFTFHSTFVLTSAIVKNSTSALDENWRQHHSTLWQRFRGRVANIWRVWYFQPRGRYHNIPPYFLHLPTNSDFRSARMRDAQIWYQILRCLYVRRDDCAKQIAVYGKTTLIDDIFSLHLSHPHHGLSTLPSPNDTEDDHFSIAWEYPGQYREVIPANFSRTTSPNIDNNSWFVQLRRSKELTDLRNGMIRREYRKLFLMF